MEGTIEIKANGTDLEIGVHMSHLSILDKMALMDGLARALQSDPLEKRIFGLVLAKGGLEATGMADVTETMIDLSALRKRNNETGLTSEEK